jgi:hypothetical protein
MKFVAATLKQVFLATISAGAEISLAERAVLELQV